MRSSKFKSVSRKIEKMKKAKHLVKPKKITSKNTWLEILVTRQK
jgi:hypothetical protein